MSDRNERHFREFYTPRRLKLDKEHRQRSRPRYPDEYVDHHFRQFPSSNTPKKRPDPEQQEEQQNSANKPEVKDPSASPLKSCSLAFSSPPPSASPPIEATTNSVTTALSTCPPPGSSRLLRKLYQQRGTPHHLYKQSTESDNSIESPLQNILSSTCHQTTQQPWISPPAVKPNNNSSNGDQLEHSADALQSQTPFTASKARPRLLDTGAKRLVQMARVPHDRHQKELSNLRPKRFGYDGTNHTPSASLLKSTNASRHQQRESYHPMEFGGSKKHSQTSSFPPSTALQSSGTPANLSQPSVSPAMPDLSSGTTPLRTPGRSERLCRQYQCQSPGLRRLDLGPSLSPRTVSTDGCGTPSSRSRSSLGSLNSFWDAVAALPVQSPANQSSSSPSRSGHLVRGMHETPPSMSRRSWNPMAEILLRMPSQDEASEIKEIAGMIMSSTTTIRDTSFAGVICSKSPIKMVTTQLRDVIPTREGLDDDGRGPSLHSIARPVPQRAAIPPLRKITA